MEQNGKGWLIWLLVVPLAAGAGALLARWALHGRSAAPAPAVSAPAQPAPDTAPAAAAPAPQPAEESYELPGDEPAGQEAVVSWGGFGAEKTPPAAGTAGKAPPASPEEQKKSFGMGSVYGALTAAADKLLGNPKALSALFNNEYVVKGFMSRETVKKATASKASLAAYLKNPANVERFMSKSPVQRGMNNSELVGVMASSLMANSMMDTPGGKALLSDPAAMAEVLKANPQLAQALANPAFASALARNPKAAGVVTSLTLSGAGR